MSVIKPEELSLVHRMRRGGEREEEGIGAGGLKKRREEEGKAWITGRCTRWDGGVCCVTAFVRASMEVGEWCGEAKMV